MLKNASHPFGVLRSKGYLFFGDYSSVLLFFLSFCLFLKINTYTNILQQLVNLHCVCPSRYFLQFVAQLMQHEEMQETWSGNQWVIVNICHRNKSALILFSYLNVDGPATIDKIHKMMLTKSEQFSFQ